MIKNSLNKFYYLAGGAFLFALIKYVFIRSVELSPKFFIFEFISFGLFLVLVYLFDRYKRECAKDKLVATDLLDEIKTKTAEKISDLEREIRELKAMNEGGHDGDELSKTLEYYENNLTSDNKIEEIGIQILVGLAKDFDISIGLCYLFDNSLKKYIAKGTYGLGDDVVINEMVVEEGLNGQAIKDQKVIVINDIDDDYFNIESGSGSAKPKYIYLLPIVKDKESIGLIEVASFAKLNIENWWDKINENIVNAISL